MALPMDNPTTPLLGTEADKEPQQHRPRIHPEISAEKWGFAWMFVSAACFAAAAVLAREAQERFSLPTSGALQLRGCVQLALTALTFLLVLPGRGGDQLHLPRDVYSLLGARAFFGALSLSLMFAGLRCMPAGDAVAVFFTLPLFALLFGSLLLGERATAWDALSAFVSLAGVALVAEPWRAARDAHIATLAPQTHRLKGTLLTLAGAVTGGLSVTIVRRLGARIHCMTSVLAHGVGTAVTAAVLGGVRAMWEGGIRGLMTMVCSALFAFAGQVAMNRGLQICRVGAGMLIANAEVPLTYAIALWQLGETPGLAQGIGGTLVFAAGVILAMQKV